MNQAADFDDDFDDAPSGAAAHPGSPATLALVLAETAADLDDPGEVELPAERERTLRTPGFTRMPVGWHGDAAAMMTTINAMAAARIAEDFAGLFDVIADIEVCAASAGADPATGEAGRPNFAALAESDKEHWVLELATGMAAWEQRAADYWGEAMMAKVIRQEAFTDGYLGVSGRSTVEDRTQAGQAASREDYYFAVLCALLHKRAAAACRSAELLCQRLKDACAR